MEGGNTEFLFEDNNSKNTEKGLMDLDDGQGMVGGNQILNGDLETRKQLNRVESGGTVTPSSEKKGKQNGMEGEGNTKTTFEDNNLNGTNGCEFKRGGVCKKHGVKGIRSVKSTKVWNKKKDGMFAWVWKKQTVYTCAVEPDIRGHPSPTSGMATENDISTQGMEKQTNGTTCGVFSGEIITGAGANLDRTEHEQKN